MNVFLRSRTARVASLFLPLFVGCGHSSGPSLIQKGSLAADAIARVGEESIALVTVQRIVDKRRLSAAQGLDLSISDAIFSEQAKHELAQSGLPRYLERLAFVRALLDQIRDEAHQRGAASDEEISAIASERWWEFDRPPLFRTTHAVVEVNKAADDAPARALAQKIQAAVQGVSDPKEFHSRAAKITSSTLKVVVEDLPPIAQDGRAVEPNNPPEPGVPTETVDPAFAEAAARLDKVGQLSPIVRSQTGYHVILLTEIIPPKKVPIEEQRGLLQDEVVTRRAKGPYQQILDELRAKTPITVVSQAQALMESVQDRYDH